MNQRKTGRRQPGSEDEPESSEKTPHNEQTITVDAARKTVEVSLKGKDGLVLLKAIAFFVVVSSVALAVYCLAYLLEVIGENFFDSVGMIVWLICLFGSAFYAHWPQ